MQLSPWLAIQRGALLLKNVNAAIRLLSAGRHVHDLIRRRPTLILNFATKPFITRRWDAKTRTDVFINHCRTVARIGGLLDFPEHRSVELLRLSKIEGSYRIALGQSWWLQMEGLMTFGLYEDDDRFFHLSCCLGTASDGELIAYIGGIQGVSKPRALEQHRVFTKRSFGMRPRDFLVEAFRLFCLSLGVQRIYAVPRSNHVNALTVECLPDYDRLWIERGGQFKDGFFLLSPNPTRRRIEDIPKNKRSMYRRRFDFLDDVGREFCRKAVNS